MRQLDAEWIKVFEESVGRRDFELAIHRCDDVVSVRTIDGWIEDLSSIGCVSGLHTLHDRIFGVLIPQ
jgi:hypothetical protein